MGWTNIRKITVLTLLASGVIGMQTTAVAADWPYWRGPHFNGTSDETGLSGSVSEASIQWRDADARGEFGISHRCGR